MKSCLPYILAIVGVIALAMSITSRLKDNESGIDKKYEDLLQKYSGLVHSSIATNEYAKYFSENPRNTEGVDVWQTNGVFILHDLEISKVRWGCFYDDITVKFHLPSKSLKPNEAIFLPDPKNLPAYEGELLTFKFRNCYYMVFVNDGTWAYQIMGGKVPLNPDGSCVDLSEYLGKYSMIHYCKFWRSNYYSHSIYLSKGMLSQNEWMSVERNDSNQCVVKFHILGK